MRSLVLRLALVANWTLVAGAVLGFAIGMVSHSAGEPRLVNVLGLFRYKVGWALIELVVSAAWMFAYWAWLRWRPPVNVAARWAHASLAILSATNLLYHFPTLLTVMSKTSRGEFQLDGPVTASSFRELAFRPDVLAHSVHFWLASIAVSGVLLFWTSSHARLAKTATVTGAWFALAATGIQIASGLWLLMVTPPASMSRLMGGEVLPTSLLVASILCAFYLLQMLASVAFGETDRKSLRWTTAMMLLTVVMMTGTLYLLRR